MKFKRILLLFLVKLLLIFSKTVAEESPKTDRLGYVVYCPCMGRKFSHFRYAEK